MKSLMARLALSLSLVVSFLPTGLVHAQLDACSVDFSPATVNPDNDVSFAFGIYNSNSAPINWLRVTRPAGNPVTLEDGSASGWDTALAADTVTFINGSLVHGGAQGFFVQALVGSNEGGPYTWTVQVSDDPGGAGAITCGGNLSMSIATTPSVINIFNVGVTNVGATNVTVHWDTDVRSNSRVAYGNSATYGNLSPLDMALTLSHDVTLTGLQPNSPYHFAVMSATPKDGGSAVSSDNTFLTAVVPPKIYVPPVTVEVPVTVEALVSDNVPPAIKLLTSVPVSFRSDVALAVLATDNLSVRRIDYSLDGGKSWIQAPNTPDMGSKRVAMTLQPAIPDDGSYQFMARVTDGAGNQAVTPPVTINVDRLPPRPGMALLSYGAQEARLDSEGRWRVVTGMDLRLSLSAVGGPVSARLTAHQMGGKQGDRSFFLRRDDATGLWQAALSFSRPGRYTLTAELVDGAGNAAQRTLPEVVVAEPGVVQHDKQPLAGAQVTLYVRYPPATNWQVWEGGAYGQANPYTTRGTGSFAWVLPAGTYYVAAQARGYDSLITQEFHLDSTAVLAPVLSLKPAKQVGIGSWKVAIPGVGLANVPMLSEVPAGAAAPAALVGSDLPNFQLPLVAGGMQTAVALRGRPTIVTLLSTWAPVTSEQLPALAQLQDWHGNANVLPVFVGEHRGLVAASLAQAGYTWPVAVDSQNDLAQALPMPVAPTHYVLDRTGRVVSVHYGVMSATQLRDALGGL